MIFYRYKKFLLCLIFTAFAVPLHLLAQSYTPVNIALPDSLSANSFDEFTWGDLDNDGDHDAMIHSISLFGASQIKNMGPGLFINTDTLQYDSLNFTPCNFSFINRFLDVDNDNDLDILNSSCLMINQGNNTFTNQPLNLQLTQFQVADFNNDGLIDILDISNPGQALNTRTITIYKNEGNFQFIQAFTTTLDLLTIQRNTLIADYDKDGDMDLAFLLDNPDPSANVWTNNNFLGIELLINELNFNFSTESIMASSIPLSGGNTAENVEINQFGLADFDNDGDLDIQASGIQNVQNQQVISFNVVIGNAAIPYILDELTGFRLAKKALYDDFDADGDMDFMLMGMKQDNEFGERREFTLFDNDGTGNFTEIDDQFSLLGVESGLFEGTPSSIDLDYDNDRDIVYTASDNQINYQTLGYMNEAAINTPPNAPAGLNITPDCQNRELLIDWIPPTDNESPSSSLRYNVRVGTSPGGTDVVSPMALSNGFLLNPSNKFIRGSQFKLKDVSLSDTFYISVQAIDPSGVGSAFSPEQVFYFSSGSFSFESTGLPAATHQISLGDFTGSGEFDILSAGYNGPASLGNSREAIINYYLASGGSFTNASNDIDNNLFSYYQQGDYDGDGDLDLLGVNVEPGQQPGYRIINVEDKNFNPGPGEILPDVAYIKWADLDQDGRPELVQSYKAESGNPTIVVERLDGTSYQPIPSFNIDAPSLDEINFVVTDIQEDGRPDLILYGLDTAGVATSSLFVNDGNLGWQNTASGLPGLLPSSIVKPADRDNDGDEDLLIVNPSNKTVRFYENDVNNDYLPYIHIDSIQGNPVSADVGDINNDGLLDVVLSTNNNGIEYFFYIRKAGSGFEKLCTEVPFSHADGGQLDMGDIDQDNDLDIVISAFNPDSANNQVYIIRNEINTQNNPPSPPGQLQAAASCEGVNFTWTPGSDDTTPADALTYRIKIGTQPGQYNLLEAEAKGDTSLQPAPGVIKKSFFEWRRVLPPGNYYWTVQAVDHQFIASPFAPEQVLKVTPNNAFIQNDSSQLPSKIAQGGRGIYAADYDKDGNMDIFLRGLHDQHGVGADSSYLIRNNGPQYAVAHTFPSSERAISNPWLDIDFNGYPDLIFHGDSIGIPYMYFNENGTSFTQDNALGNQLVNAGAIITGQAARFDPAYFVDGILSWNGLSNSPFNAYYTGNTYQDFNQGLLNFINNADEQTFKSISSLAISLAESDLDNDGLKDKIEMLQSTISNIIGQPSLIRVNLAGSTRSQNLVTIDVTGNAPSVDIGDYNNDGWQDIVVGNMKSNGSPTTIIYKNNGDGTFAQMNTSIKGTFEGFVKWADYNNDGLLDLLCGGEASNGIFHTTLYEQDSAVGLIPTGCFDAMSQTDAVWIDQDNDGKLDFWQTGRDETNTNPRTSLKIYNNVLNVNANNEPSTPQNINTSFDPTTNQIIVNWTEASDAETPSAALTYNIRIGTQPGASDIVSPVPGPYIGNTGTAELWKILVKPGNTYFISLQTVDQGFATSSWSNEISIDVPALVYDVIRKDSLELVRDANLADFDNDGDFDRIFQQTHANLHPDSSGFDNNKLVIATLDNDLMREQIIQLQDTFIYNHTLLDYNRDGLIDIYYHFQSFRKGDRILINQGNNQFSPMDIGLRENNTFYSPLPLRFIDFDNDGDFDVVDNNNLYENQDDTAFIYVRDLEVNSNFVEPKAYADFNNDGYIDILVEEPIGDNAVDLYLFINDNHFGFSDTIALPNPPGLIKSPYSFNLKDFDSDGLLDILFYRFTGLDNPPGEETWNLITQVLSPNPVVTGISILDKSNLVHTGDFDLDGDIDILGEGADNVIGWNKAGMFANDGNGNFNQEWNTYETGFPINLSGIGDFSNENISIADHDHDGFMDIIVHQASDEGPFNGYYNSFVQLVRNQGPQNTIPDPPGQLQASYDPSDSTITLTWNAGSDGETPSTGLTYALRLGTASGQGDLRMPFALPSGRRTLVQKGNLDLSSTYTFQATPGQQYFWTVQSVDLALSGSPFAPEQVFSALYGPNNVTGQVGTSNNAGSRKGIQVNSRNARIREEVSGVIIKLRDLNADRILFSTVSDNNGEFKFPNLPEGNYKLEVEYNDLPMDKDNPVISFNNENDIEIVVVIGEEQISYRIGEITALDVSRNKAILIYPNPSDEVLNIVLSNYSYPVNMKIFDTTGRIFMEKVIHSGDNNLNVSQLAPGIYNIVIDDTNKRTTKILMVK